MQLDWNPIGQEPVPFYLLSAESEGQFKLEYAAKQSPAVNSQFAIRPASGHCVPEGQVAEGRTAKDFSPSTNPNVRRNFGRLLSTEEDTPREAKHGNAKEIANFLELSMTKE